MTRRRMHGLAALALAGALALSAAHSASGAGSEKKDDDWENRFSGHEMWLKSLDAGLARSAKDGKPLLVDFYSHT